jgi:hypothetical protein
VIRTTCLLAHRTWDDLQTCASAPSKPRLKRAFKAPSLPTSTSACRVVMETVEPKPPPSPKSLLVSVKDAPSAS